MSDPNRPDQDPRLNEHQTRVNEPQAGETPAKATPARRRRRWPYVLGTLALLLIVLAALAPYLASTGPGTRLIASTVNGYINGTIRIDDLALSWTGPSKVEGIRVLDPAGQEVLQIDTITWTGGLWSLLKDPYQLQEITARAPEATLALNEKGELTIVEAFRSREPSDKPLPDLRGRFLIENGRIHVRPRQGVPYELRDAAGRVSLDSLSNWEGTLQLTAPGGGVVQSRFSLQDLLSNDRIDLLQARGTLNVQTVEPLDAGEIGAIFQPDTGMKGKAKIDLAAAFESGKVDANLNTSVTGLSTSPRSGAQIRPIDVALSGKLAGTRDQVTADLELTGEPGGIQTQVAFAPSRRLLEVDFQQVLGSLLTGKTVALPEFTAVTNGSLDIPRLTQAVPALLNVRQGVEVAEGALIINDLAIRGGDAPALSGMVQFTRLRARQDGRDIEVEPVVAALDVTVPEQGLQIRRAEFTSAFARIRGTGDASRLTLVLEIDSERFREQMGRIFDLGVHAMDAQLTGRAELARTSDDRADVSLDVAAEGIRYLRDGRELRFRNARLTGDSHLALAGTRVTRWATENTRLVLEDQAAITAQGFYALGDATFELALKMEPTRVEYLASKLQQLEMDLPEGLSGHATAQARALRSGQDAPIQSAGQLVLNDLARTGRPIGKGQTSLAWAGGQYDPDGLIQVASASLESSFARAAARKIAYRPGQARTLSATLEADTLIAELMAALAPLAGWQDPPAIAGRFHFSGEIGSTGDVLTFKGQGGVDEFVAGAGEQAVRDPRVQFATAARINSQSETIDLERFDLTSQLARLQLTGLIEQYRTRRNLNLTCVYDAQWAPLVNLLHEFAPATTQLVSIAGSTSDKFQIRGPLNPLEAKSPFGSLTAQPNVTWDSARLAGLSVGPARLSPRLADGQIAIPASSIPASGGTLNLAGTIDLTTPQPLYRLPGQHQMLQNVRVDTHLSRELLSRFNPVFAEVSEIDGTASLAVQNLVLPLGGEFTEAAGSGRLGLSQMQLRPQGFLNTLLELGSLAKPAAGATRDMYTVRMSDLDFAIQNGRIGYDNFTLFFHANDFDLKFRGSVGLDGTLDLIVSVPVRPGLLERFGVQGQLVEHSRALAGVRVDIPVSGTRRAPRLDLSAVDIKPLIAQATRKTIEGEAGQAIGRLIGTSTGPADQPGRERRDGKDSAPPDPRRIGEEALKGIFGGRESEGGRREDRERRRGR